jgi:hypothetical protein
MHEVLLKQVTAVRLCVPRSWTCQFEPPSVVVITALPPTAMHIISEGQVTLARGPTPLGRGRCVQAAPPSVVLSSSAVLSVVSPTASQLVDEEQASAFRLMVEEGYVPEMLQAVGGTVVDVGPAVVLGATDNPSLVVLVWPVAVLPFGEDGRKRTKASTTIRTMTSTPPTAA